jgi:hypothetical protein
VKLIPLAKEALKVSVTFDINYPSGVVAIVLTRHPVTEAEIAPNLVETSIC